MVTLKWLPRFFSYFQDIFLNDFIKNPQTRNVRAFLPLNISAVGSVFIDQLYIELGSLPGKRLPNVIQFPLLANKLLRSSLILDLHIIIHANYVCLNTLKQQTKLYIPSTLNIDLIYN